MRGFRMAAHAAVLMAVAMPATSQAKKLFCDTFSPAASSAWGNQRGQWRSAQRQYDAAAPNNNPVTYSDVTTLTALTDFTVTVTVNDLNDGGIWLRSTYNNGAPNGILLVTGGDTGTNNGFYWHVVTNGAAGAQLQPVSVPGIQGKKTKLKIVVKGDTYSLYINGGTSPISVLTDSTYRSGSAGLYDFSPTGGASSPRGETFSNFCISR